MLSHVLKIVSSGCTSCPEKIEDTAGKRLAALENSAAERNHLS